MSVAQASFHEHFCQSDHNGIKDWSFTLIDKASDLHSLRKKECFWQLNLTHFIPMA